MYLPFGVQKAGTFMTMWSIGAFFEKSWRL